MNDKYKPSLTYKELGAHISALGVKKANTEGWQQALLGGLAGLYLAFGGHIFLVALSSGLGKVLGGAVFSVGLVLIILAGAELFTGNVIMIIGVISGLYQKRKLLKNWAIVYTSNFAGAVITALLIWWSGLLGEIGQLSAVGETAHGIATAKLSLTFSEAFIRGILCNILVILAVLMAAMAKDTISKLLCIMLPIMTFVACGFEHCIANMYLITLGLLAGGTSLTGFFDIFLNLIPVTLGNIVGGLFILLIHPNRIRQLKKLYSAKLTKKTSPSL